MLNYIINFFEIIKYNIRCLIYSHISTDFYKDVYHNFKGYGLRYIFCMTYISAIITSSFMITKLNDIDDYLTTKTPTTRETKELDSILNSWRSFYYDGSIVYTKDGEPIVINDSSGSPIIGVDAENKLAKSVRRQVPLIFTKTNLIISAGDGFTSLRNTKINYKSLFGKKEGEVVIDAAFISNGIKDTIEYLNKLIIYVFFPTLVIANFTSILLDKSLMIILVYLLLNILYKQKTRIKPIIRSTLYSCGFAALLGPLSIISHWISAIAKFSELWTNLVLIGSIIQISRIKKED
ncbi:MAG: hypothetical protein SFT93_03660 [Rickettsiaceae bacterium]|nr:hypothetical protein [Rickettsiaceae bacterium]